MSSVAKITKKKSRIFIRAMAMASKIMAATSVAACVYMLLAPLAAAERGYTGAIGGEGALTLIAFWLVYKLFTYVFENISE